MSEERAKGPLVWLTEAQVAALVDLNDAMAALRTGFIEEAEGRAKAVDKALGQWPGGAMHALGSMSPGQHYAGFKTWVHTDKGATAIFSLFDTRDGQLLAVLEAATLGQIRTSAVSGLAADVLAAPGADEMALIGTGAQALTQVAAVAAVRPLRRLRVYSPTADKRAAFVEKARAQFGFEVIDSPSLDDAVRDVPIVTLITRASAPFLDAGLLSPGVLLIAAGAILPANAECLPNVLERSTGIYVDSLRNAQLNSRELREYFGEDGDGWKAVRTLGALLSEGGALLADRDITMFKPMGTGLSDLSVAIMAYERAMAQGIGLSIDQPQRVMPRWRTVDVK
ncbi:ornithine cyclodeaminase [Sphingomonas sp. Root710]|uniref:ornithine cyclodeaminase family protein n=1 Tax=Sphingomonas sp. Root710 TaxID=1736594 RepID=UPI0006FFDC62|nr:ornithine cyclodeaminase family protein [Sphingomonas sp. Root710]KRB82202.1 ornithine cyclodeaminase [Sphingomonas sp. Root710]